MTDDFKFLKTIFFILREFGNSWEKTNAKLRIIWKNWCSVGGIFQLVLNTI